MAIVILAQDSISVGGGLIISNSFNYDERRAYVLYVDFSSSNFGEIFSFVRIYPYIQPNGGVARLDARYFDLEILALPQILFLPLTQLINGNGSISFYLERRSFYVGGGEGTPVDVTLSYDDSVSVRTWLT